ncbi:autophagy protein 13, partial [Biomphalaria glabrata]
PVNRSESPYCFAVSPGSIEKEEHELRARFPSESSPWTHSSILNLEELPEPVVGAFSKASHKKVIEHKVPFEGLMRRSMVARQESEKSKQSYDEWAIDGRRSSRPDSKEGEKENVPIDSQRGQKMSIEDEFVMVDKPPFAADDDPRDVKAFLGVFFRAPKTYETQECKVSVEEYLCDVEALVSKLEEDMPVLDEFCQSVINLNSQEEEDENPLFS